MPAEIPEERIFEAAIDTVLERGYTGATTKQIAEAAGISEMTLFRRFGTKDKLLRAALTFEAAKFIGEAIAYTGDVQTDLERVVRTYNRLLKKRGRIALELIAELPRRPELREVARIPQEAMVEIAALVGRYQREGKLQGNSPWQATLELLGPVFVINALKSVNPLLPASVDPRAVVERYLAGWGSQATA